MFRNMSDERRLSGGQNPASLARHGASSALPAGQESSWIGLLSVVSRPALSFLQKYVTGGPRNAALAEREAGWVSGEVKRSCGEGRELLRHLDSMVPAPQLALLLCQHDAGAGGLPELRPGGPAPWLSAESLQELGIPSAEPASGTRNGYFSSLRTFLNHVVWSSSQEIRPTEGREWGADGQTRTWWGSFWAGESSQNCLLSELPWAEEVTGRLCPQQAVAETKAGATTTALVQSSNRESTLGENTGRTHHKDQLANNGGLHTVQNAVGSAPNHRLCVGDHLSGAGGAAASCEVVLLSPDHDNGYSSLEEEHVLISHLYVMTASGEQSLTNVETPKEEENSEERNSISGKMGDEEAVPSLEAHSGLEMVPPTPQCQNKAIAYIMGCPCSDSDSSQSDGESSDDDDDDGDDGFDSECTSNLSDSTDEDEDEDADADAESEADHLWRSLCQNLDPYNPRNFTASLHTGSTLPTTIPSSSTPPLSSQSTPTSSPPRASEAWDDSTSASEVDEAESLHLWSSFSCSSDPYSPFNFQAPLRTQGPSKAAWSTKASPSVLRSPHHDALSPPDYRKEEAEERLDSGFSEHSSGSSSSQSCAPTKKVRFSDYVEEFFASCGEEEEEEDRRGPWEELARDRCRFLRRCQEVEQHIAYCLEPQHRSLVYNRLTMLYAQDA